MIRIDINEYMDIIIDTADQLEALNIIGDMLASKESFKSNYLIFAGMAVKGIANMVINKDVKYDQVRECLINIIMAILDINDDPKILELLDSIFIEIINK